MIATTETQIAGLRTLIVTPAGRPRMTVVILHGFAMVPDDLAPFAATLQLPATFLFPQAPHAVAPRGFAWWEVDQVVRDESIRNGPRDLANAFPPGRLSARATLQALLQELRTRFPDNVLILGGFSQGGMLSLDTMLQPSAGISALILMSSSRIALEEWRGNRSRLQNLPILVSHGREDADLAFSAGEALRDFVAEAGASVTWVPFDGGHQTPLVVWRQVRKFLQRLAPSGIGLQPGD